VANPFTEALKSPYPNPLKDGAFVGDRPVLPPLPLYDHEEDERVGRTFGVDLKSFISYTTHRVKEDY